MQVHKLTPPLQETAKMAKNEETQTENTNFNGVRSISVKNLLKLTKNDVPQGERVPIGIIIGRILGANIKPNPLNPENLDTAWVGEFQAQATGSNDWDIANVLYLPTAGQGLLEVVAKPFGYSSQEKGSFTMPPNQFIEIALQIFVERNERSGTGLAYLANPLIQNNGGDALSDLRKTALKALPAPTKE